MLYLDIFDRDYLSRTPVKGVVVPTDINYLRRLYTYNDDAIQEYYLSRFFAVKNTHILSRMLEHIPAHFNYDDYRYVEYLDERMPYLARHFKFTSEIEKGEVHKPFFYGNEGEEIYFADTSPFNIKQCVVNWKREPCIQILSHPRNDGRLLLPLGIDDGHNSGTSYLAINVIKLGLKFREWQREQYVNEMTGGNVYNKNFFIIKHVLTTLVKDHIDHMLMNRVMDKFYDREIVVPNRQHKFKIFEPDTQLDRYVDQTLDVITGKKLDFVNIMNNIQLIFRVNATELLWLPDIGTTRQARWALVASRLKYMIFLYDVAKDKYINRVYINDWIRLMERLERDKGMFDMFSYEQNKEIKEMMYKIRNM